MSDTNVKMTKEQAWAWANRCTLIGTGEARYDYLKTRGIGTLGKKHWNDELFTLGVEYGILIAVAKIFGDEGDILETLPERGKEKK